MKETVTIINSAKGAQISKVFRDPNHQPLKFSPSSEFPVSQQFDHDLQNPASVSGELETEPTKAVISRLPLILEGDPVAWQY